MIFKNFFNIKHITTVLYWIVMFYWIIFSLLYPLTNLFGYNNDTIDFMGSISTIFVICSVVFLTIKMKKKETITGGIRFNKKPIKDNPGCTKCGKNKTKS